MMLAFWVWSIGLWLRGLEEHKPVMLTYSSLLIALAALTKYYGMALIPLLLVYSLIKKRSLGPWALYFLIPSQYSLNINGTREYYTAVAC